MAYARRIVLFLLSLFFASSSGVTVVTKFINKTPYKLYLDVENSKSVDSKFLIQPPSTVDGDSEVEWSTNGLIVVSYFVSYLPTVDGVSVAHMSFNMRNYVPECISYIPVPCKYNVVSSCTTSVAVHTFFLESKPSDNCSSNNSPTDEDNEYDALFLSLVVAMPLMLFGGGFMLIFYLSKKYKCCKGSIEERTPITSTV